LERIFRIRNRLDEVPGVLDAIEDSCRGEGLATQTALDMRLVAEEVLTNIVKYAHGAWTNTRSNCDYPPPWGPCEWNSATTERRSIRSRRRSAI